MALRHLLHQGRGLATLYRVALGTGTLRLLLLAILRPVGVFVTMAGLYGTKLFVDAVATGSTAEVWAAAWWTGGAMLGSSAAQFVAYHFSLRVKEELGRALELRLMSLSGGIGGVEHLEQAEQLNKIDVLRQEATELAGLVDSFLGNVSLVIQTIVVAALLAQVSAALLLLPLFTVPSIVLSGVADGIRHRHAEAIAEGRRRARHLFEVGTAAEASKELRVFGLARELSRLYRYAWSEIYHLRRRDLAGAAAISFAGWLTFGAGYVAAMVVVVRAVAAGQASVGNVVLVLGLSSQVNGLVWGAMGVGSWVTRTLRLAGRYQWLEDLAGPARDSESQSTPPPAAGAPERLQVGIRLEGVAFRYPGAQSEALRELSLELPGGCVVALVGENGAGKSTVIKLLTKMYRPTQGRILVDGVDLQAVDTWSWRRRLAVGFQDMCRFEFVLRESVGVGDVPHMEDRQRVAQALRRAGDASWIERLPQGLETQLGRAWEGGVEPSGGQWQRVGLGRASMRRRPLLLILDEPSAALDPQAESEVLTSVIEAARANRDGVALIVSHRLATVRTADVIVVLSAGRVVETGSHEALMRAGGLYRELYTLQARAYR
ncbi:MAG TPA: ABC transporter ATP-binding protein [Chloroflexota bacterium]|nr:ABC transporter ATP-binding protein [Chloroflexota bacterium]